MRLGSPLDMPFLRFRLVSRGHGSPLPLLYEMNFGAADSVVVTHTLPAVYLRPMDLG